MHGNSRVRGYSSMAAHLIHTILVGLPQAAIWSVLALGGVSPGEATLVVEAHGLICPAQHLSGCVSGRHAGCCCQMLLKPAPKQDMP